MSSTTAAVAHEATSHDLWMRAAEVAGRLNRTHGELVEIAAELIEGGHWGDGGFTSPEHLLVVRAGLSPAQAGDVVRIARRRAELPDAVAALAAGELSLGQVAVVARHGRADHQAGIAAFARTATVPQLRRALSTSVFLDPETGMPSTTRPSGVDASEAEAPVDGCAEAEQDPTAHHDPLAALRAAEARRLADRACARPDLSMHYDEVGRFHLRYSAPAEIGALVEQAVKEAKDALFTAAAGDDGSFPVRGARSGAPLAGVASSRPTYADAIAEIAGRSLSTISSTSRASHYRVYLHLDTSGGWVNGGGAITPRMAARFSCDGTVTPLWETEGRPVSVGRDQRILPARTRRLVEDRDRGCRIPGCSTTRFVEIHHLDHWADGGATDYDTQVSLCPFHHDAHHRGDLTITGDPTRPDGLTVTNRYGLAIRPPTAAELAPTDAHATEADPAKCPAYPSPSGGPMRARDIEFVPDAWQRWREPAVAGQPPPLRLVLEPEGRAAQHPPPRVARTRDSGDGDRTAYSEVVFGRNKTLNEQQAEAVGHAPREGAKNRPTPKRKDQEAANRRPLVVTDRKAARDTDKVKRREAQLKQRAAMATGDDAHLPARDKGPVRRYIRDYIDARWNLGEFMLPVMIVVLALSFIRIPALFAIVSISVYGLLLAAAVDGFLMWRRLKKQLIDKFGEDKVGRGLAMYAVMRGFQIRRSRMPKALAKRGDYPT